MDNSDRLDKLESKLDLLQEKQSNILVATTENTVSLKEHMAQTLEVRKQTQILQDMYSKLCEDVDGRFKAVEQEMKPYLTFVDRAKFIMSIVGWIVTIYFTSDKLGLFNFFIKIKN
jgi:hypothetical protein